MSVKRANDVIFDRKLKEAVDDLEKARKDFILKGGSVPSSSVPPKEFQNVVLRIPVDILSMIDNRVSKRIGLNRSAWLLETIQKRLENEAC